MIPSGARLRGWGSSSEKDDEGNVAKEVVEVEEVEEVDGKPACMNVVFMVGDWMWITGSARRCPE